MSEHQPPGEYERQRLFLEKGFREAFPKLDMSNETHKKANTEFVALKQELAKSFTPVSLETVTAKINTFLTSHGAIQVVQPASEFLTAHSADARLPAVEAPKAKSELSGEASALTVAVSKLYEENVALDDDNSLRKILDAIPNEAVRESLRSKGLKISYRGFDGKVVPRNRAGALMFVQLPNEPNDEGLVFPTQSQMNAAHMFDWFGEMGKETVSRPVRSRLVDDTIEPVDKDAITEIRRSNFNKTSGNTSNGNAEIKPPQATSAEPAVVEPIPATNDDESPALDTETLDKGSVDEMKELLAKGEIGKNNASPATGPEIAAPANSAPTSPEDIYGGSGAGEQDKATAVPSELKGVFRKVPDEVVKNFATKKTKKEQENYLKNSMIAQQMQAERENRERDERIKKEEERKTARKQGRKRGSGKKPPTPVAESEPIAEVPKAESKSEFLNQEEVNTLLAGIDLSTPQSNVDAQPPEATPAVAGAEQNQETEPKVFRSNREKKEGKKEEPSFEDRKKYLNSRNKKLGAKAKEYGIKFENFVRNTGERYRKLPLKYKIGVAGALLGLNVATGGASTLVTLLTSTAMLGQRALGAASAYALIDGLYEKRLSRKEKERGSERTKFEKWKKRGYSTATALAVFIGLPGYAVKEGFDAIGGSGILKALGALMGVSPDTAELTHTIPKPAGAPAEPLVIDEIKQQIVEENARAATEVATPQESRQALRTAVEKLTRVSATADAKFEMPKHADFSIHEDDTTISPYDVTPTDQSGADDDIVQVSEDPQPVAEPESAVEPQVQQAESVEETPRTWQEKIVPEDTSPAALDQQVPTETPTEPAEPSAETVEATPVTEAPSEPPPIETPAPSAEPPQVQYEHLKEFINLNKVPINPLQGHVFGDPTGAALAYGNNHAMRLDAAQDFAKDNPNTSVWVQAEKPVFYQGAWRPWVYEVKYGGWFRGMQILGADGPSDPSRIGGINPDTFIKQLDK